MNKLDFNYNRELDIYTNNFYVDYNDGSEEYFINLFKDINNEEKKYDDVLRETKEWASLYHLSPVRTNVISSFSELFKKDSTVLEIGAGMGAVTNWLCKHFDKVDCLEGSMKRGVALKERLRKDSNVDVFIGDVLKTNLGVSKYDLATVIGVLEYIPYYSENKDIEESVVDFIKKISSSMKEDGIFLLAIENKFGLKYFSGAKEDHNGKAFSGIMGYPFKSPITFGRNELENLLIKGGFSNIQFYNCSPDYKMPTLICREDKEIYNLNADILCRKNTSELIGSRQQLFIEPLVAQGLFNEKILHKFSNSFIVLCSKSSKINLRTSWLVNKINNSDYLLDEYKHTVQIRKNKDNRFVVERKSINNNKLNEKEDIKFNLYNEEYIKGNSVFLKSIKATLKEDNYSELITIIEKIKSQLILSEKDVQLDEDGIEIVNGSNIDYTFWNLIEKDDEFKFIDKKWNLKTSIPIDYIIYRSLIEIYNITNRFIKEKSFEEFVLGIIPSIYKNFNLKRLLKIQGLEKKFIEKVYNKYESTSIDKYNYQNYNVDINEINTKSKLLDYISLNEEKLYKYITSKLKGESIYIWGAGTHTENLFRLLSKQNFDLNYIKGIIDSDSEKIKLKNNLNGIPIIFKDDFIKNKFETNIDVIISSASFEQEIYSQLIEMEKENLNIIRLYDNKEFFKVLL
jgi:hypothetical protein